MLKMRAAVLCLATVWTIDCKEATVSPLARGASVRTDATARIALLVLKGTLDSPLALNKTTFVLRPNTDQTSAQQAIEFLGSLEKPSRCWATLDGETIAISCKPNVEPDVKAFHEDWTLLRQSTRHETLARREIASSENPTILFHAGPDRLVATLRDLEAFEQEYFIPHMGAFDAGRGTGFSPDQSASRVLAEYGVWPSGKSALYVPGGDSLTDGLPGPVDWWR